MRIGMMLDAYKPHISGVTNYVDANKKFLESYGHQVYVFTFGDDNFQDGEQNVIRSPGLTLSSEEGFYLSLRYSRDAQKLLHSMDLIHVQHPFLSGRLAIRYTKGRGIPLVFTNHSRYDLYAKVYLPMLPGEISETILKAYMPSFCRSVDRVIAPSPGLRDVLLSLGVDVPVEVVPNGVDMTSVQAEYEPLDRSQFGFRDEDVVLIYLGRVAPEKNMTFLLRSFAGVAESCPNARLLIVGDGSEFENIQIISKHMNLQEKVYLTGQVSYAEVPRFLHMADAFVTASVTEVHPLSVIEAMGAGLPVLGIVSPGVGDTVEDGVTGYLAKSEDMAIFTAKMMLLVSNDQKRRAMGEQAKIQSEQYDIRRTSRLLEQQYQEVLSHTRPVRNSLRARVLRVLDRWTG
jgi:1,2-diacylglycerol 3-alpha-glucosyltransferase